MTSNQNGPQKRKLLDCMRDAIRVRHMARSTEDCYVNWVRRFILFHGKRHPAEMGKREVEAFLTHLAVEGHVSGSTQTQALSAILLFSGSGNTCSQRPGHQRTRVAEHFADIIWTATTSPGRRAKRSGRRGW